MRISAHDLKIEKDRYSKKYIERTQRLCHHCLSHGSNSIEDETHFTVNCPLYDEQRKLLLIKLSLFVLILKNYLMIRNISGCSQMSIYQLSCA